VDANRRVLQTGSMQRSSNEFRVACELVRNGVIGKVTRVECSFGDPGLPCDSGGRGGRTGTGLGPLVRSGPLRAYSSVLSPRGIHQGFPAWRNYREYGSGGVGDWGAHHLDIAQWGLGMDASGPVEVKAAGDAEGQARRETDLPGGIPVEHGDGFGIEFFGEGGVVSVNRGRFEVVVGGKTVASYKGKETETSVTAEVRKAEALFLKDAKVRLYVSSNHIADFLDCVKSRTKPITSEQVGARSAICCHLLNQSYYHHASFGWDPARFEFTGGTGDPKWLTRDYRAPWSV
jgi:predicted dehydrogenase